MLHRIFTACFTFLLLLCRKVGGGRKTASKMSAKRLYEQARATLRTKQRGTDGRVKEHKRQRKQIHSLSLSLSLSLAFFLSLSLAFFLSLSLCFCHHIFFLFGLISFLMTNTLIDTACFLCLFPFFLFSFVCVSSYGLGTYIGHPTAQRSHVDCNQLHSRKMPASSDSTHDCLFAARIVGRVTYSLPLGRSISPPLLYKIKKKKTCAPKP